MSKLHLFNYDNIVIDKRNLTAGTPFLVFNAFKTYKGY